VAGGAVQQLPHAGACTQVTRWPHCTRRRRSPGNLATAPSRPALLPLCPPAPQIEELEAALKQAQLEAKKAAQEAQRAAQEALAKAGAGACLLRTCAVTSCAAPCGILLAALHPASPACGGAQPPAGRRAGRPALLPRRRRRPAPRPPTRTPSCWPPQRSGRPRSWRASPSCAPAWTLQGTRRPRARRAPGARCAAPGARRLQRPRRPRAAALQLHPAAPSRQLRPRTPPTSCARAPACLSGPAA
jgi:hypothetical protein